MPDNTQLTQEQKEERQQIISGLQKESEKSGSATLSSDQMIEGSTQYEKSMSKASRFVAVLGKTLFHRGLNMDEADLEKKGLKQTERRMDAEKEQSYQKKTSKQEEAAARRGEYTGASYTNKNSVARDALQHYRQEVALERTTGVKSPVQQSTGDEFVEMGLQTDLEAGGNIYSCMRSRDSLSEKIAELEQRQGGGEVKTIYVKHLKALLSCTDDAINTFYLANGISLDNKQVTAKVTDAAKTHLPLALEKYRFMSKNHMRLFGEELVGLIKKGDEWKQKQQEMAADEKRYSEETGHTAGIAHEMADDYDGLQSLIADNPEKYRTYKKLIDQSFTKYSQYLRKMHEMEGETDAVREMLSSMGIQGDIVDAALDGVSAVRQHNTYFRNVLRYQAESTEAFIKYMLTGERPDPLHGEYIEKTWGVKVYDDASALHIEDSVDEYKKVNKEYRDRLIGLGRAADAEKDPLKRALLKSSRDVLATPKSNCIEKGVDLALTSEDAVEAAYIQLKAFSPQKNAVLAKEPCFRDMSLALSPVTGAPTFTEEGLRDTGHKMAIVISGKDMDGNEAEQEAKSNAFADMTALYLGAADEVKRYAAANPEMLSERGTYDAIHDWSKLPRFTNKASAVAEGMEALIRSPLFTELPKDEREAFVTEYERIYGMNRAAELVLGNLRECSGKTVDEYIRQPISATTLSRLTVDRQMQECHDKRGRAYLDPSYQRSYRDILPQPQQPEDDKAE